MKKILSEFLFGQFLCSTSLGCPFTSLWEAFFINYWAAYTFSSTLLPNSFLTEVLSGSCWTISVEVKNQEYINALSTMDSEENENDYVTNDSDDSVLSGTERQLPDDAQS